MKLGIRKSVDFMGHTAAKKLHDSFNEKLNHYKFRVDGSHVSRSFNGNYDKLYNEPNERNELTLRSCVRQLRSAYFIWIV